MSSNIEFNKAKLIAVCSELQKAFVLNSDVIIEPGERKIIEQRLHEINQRDGTRLTIVIVVRQGKTQMEILDPTSYTSVKLCRYDSITRTAVG